MRYFPFILLFVSGIASAQPQFEIDGGFERNYGRVPLKTIHDTLTIRNSGNAVLHIIGINPTCGCTATIIDTNTVAPGGTAHVYIKIEPPDAMGKTHKTIVFLTNDLTRPSQVVGLGFEILRDIGPSPRHFIFAGCRVHTPCVTSVTLYNLTEAPITLFRQPMTVAGLKCLMPDTLTIAAHDTVPYRLQWTADTTGFQTGRFILNSTSNINPVIEFSVIANVADENGVPVMPKMR